MAGEPPITLIGNLTGDPELRFTPSGAAVANFTVACTPRTLDRQSNEWKDGETLFISCAVWRQVAENVAESLTRGARVVVHGRLKARSYDDRDGNKRTVFECDVEEIGASMKYATAKITKTTRSGGDGGGFGGGGGGNQGGGFGGGGGNQGGGFGGNQGGGAPQNDPWATPAAGGGASGGGGGGGGQAAPQNDPWAGQSGGGSMEEPPF
ncbi:single-stranded DNA-binding protein [Streptomyces sp. SID13031]|uniref:single-stranded DNA-binding protein n=1 Tax=Streptomyces sp. SID13031 TaxID=2706046 RepID=UPI0013C9EA7D|nr:single-stranded DNA-binding protein [Streptomyces sp. SID13031]NEA36395.1 single-stranded DNA-binding protein [Streptomyces sp. SID13031]